MTMISFHSFPLSLTLFVSRENPIMMEFHNRRLLLLNEDVPAAATTTIPPPPMFLRSSSLELPPRPIFTSNLAYAFLFLFTAFFFLAFILLYIRHFSSNFGSSSGASLCRRNSSSSAVKPLPELPYRGDSKPQQAECAICLDEFREGIMVKMIPYCKHVFHPECIDTWLVEHVTCPVCRCEKIICESGKVACERVEARGDEGEETVVEIRVRDNSNNSSNRGSRFGLRRSMSF